MTQQAVPLEVRLGDEAATHRFAETLSLAVRRGDLITLSGTLGAGKTSLARAFICNALADDLAEVPSPTFSLMQSYDDAPFGSIAHVDCYRLEEPQAVEELGIDDALDTGVALVEWPEMAQGFLAEPAFAITLSLGDDSDERTATIQCNGPARARLERSLQIRAFLDERNHSGSQRHFLTGDASTRSYERITPETGGALILMNAPETPDGPIIRDGKPYSQIAKLAESMHAFAGVAAALKKAGLRAPRIVERDLDQGILLIEDLGNGQIITQSREPVPQRYGASIDLLAHMHTMQWSPACDLPEGQHVIPFYDREAMLIEAELLLDWYAPYKQGRVVQPVARDEFLTVWNALIDRLADTPETLVLRDYHSPNIIWIDDAEGHDRIGLIDFQDALIGPPAYDVASLAQDARIDVSASLEDELVERYCAAQSKDFDKPAFKAHYAIMAALRATKILGIFVRLNERDNKPAYLAHLPRMEGYLARSLRHPVLKDYARWLEMHAST